MTDPAIEKMTALGWSMVETSGFINLVGPLWQRTVDGNHEYALLTENKHHNRRHVMYAGRAPSASVATGLKATHMKEEQDLREHNVSASSAEGSDWIAMSVSQQVGTTLPPNGDSRLGAEPDFPTQSSVAIMPVLVYIM